METEPILIEQSKERKPENIFRYELDPEKGIDIVLKSAPEIRLSRKGSSDMKLSKEGDIVLKCEPIRIILEQKGGEPFDLQQNLVNQGFFPEGYNFVFINKKAEEKEKMIFGTVSGIWMCDDDDRRIELPREWENGAKDIFALLHELAHGLDKTVSKKRQEIYQCAQTMDEIQKRGAGADEEQIKQAHGSALRLKSQMERYAWAKALVIARTLKKEKGIDLLKPFRGKTPKETRENLEEYINGVKSLGCYEQLNVVQSELAEELKGLFTTKFYKGEKFTPEHRKKIRGKH